MSSKEPLYLAPTPCTTCPYRRDVPSGIWSREEYEKLPAYDNRDFGAAPMAVFHCHQQDQIGKPTVCHGWLSVHPDCIAVRMAYFAGKITKEMMALIPFKPDPALYASGLEACRAGLKALSRPGKKAREAIKKLVARKSKRGLP